MVHALRVTEAGVTPRQPGRTVRQRVGSLPPRPMFGPRLSWLPFLSSSRFSSWSSLHRKG